MKLIIFKIVEKITCGKIVKKIDDRKINNFHTDGFGVRCRKQRCGKGGSVCASIFAVSLFFTACTAESPMEIQTLTLKRSDGSTVSVRAEMARTDAERSRGFMKRKRIPDGTGMLFVFAKDEVLSFWMMNTPHPLSIAYIDSGGRIRDIYDMMPYSLAPVKSTVSVRYALEVPRGWFDRVKIKVGDTLALDFDTHAQ